MGCITEPKAVAFREFFYNIYACKPEIYRSFCSGNLRRHR